MISVAHRWASLILEELAHSEIPVKHQPSKSSPKINLGDIHIHHRRISRTVNNANLRSPLVHRREVLGVSIFAITIRTSADPQQEQ